MLAIVPLPVADSVPAPGPKNSTIALVPPSTGQLAHKVQDDVLALHQPLSLPVRRTLIAPRPQDSRKPTIASTASVRRPLPRRIMPSPPAFGVRVGADHEAAGNA